MSRIRINELARELEVKPSAILKVLPEIGVTEKKTHSSSIDEEFALKVRAALGRPSKGKPSKVKPSVEAPPVPPAAEQAESAPADRVSEPARFQTQVAPKQQPNQSVATPTSPIIDTPPADRRVETARRAPRPQPLRPPMALGKGGSAPPVIPPPAVRPTVVPTIEPVERSKPPVSPKTESAPAAPMAQAKPPVAEAATNLPARPKAPKMPPAAAQAKAVSMPAKPVPAPRPGQILSGPRQPLPAGMEKKPGVGRPEFRAKAPAIPRPPVKPQQVRPGARATTAAPQPGAKGPIVGKPAARPVVPPRPDLVARLTQQAKMPGQPQPRPGMPQRGQAPVPGQPIYRGPIRPGQPLVRGPGGGPPGARRHPQHPTSQRIEPAGPPPTPVPGRRHQTKPGSGRGQRPGERERDREGTMRPMHRRSHQEKVLAPNKDITISEGITVKELSEKLGIKASLVIKRLVERKIFATINQALDGKLADELARSFGAETNKISFEEESVHDIEQAEAEQDLQKRPPVVTVMGHVDHGKTSLLDAIRASSVAEHEAGGITQHIGAYHVEKDGNKIVFIDTPGHEAFTRMRARGAKVTDIVVLVVAADDGVMPQTLEAIDHAKAANVPIIVAVNKIDRPDANPDRVKQQLADRNLLAEDWGGDVVTVPVSAKTKENIDNLLEMILLVSDMQELKANPSRPALGTVLEAQLDRGRGPVATVLVRNGTLGIGDHFICGAVFGKVRAMFDDRGDPIKTAGPSMPVEVLGLDTLPEVGDTYQVVTDTVKAKQIVLYRESKSREQAMAKGARLTLDRLHEQLKEGEVKELAVILKTDVGGTAEVVSDALQKLSNEKVKVDVIRAGVGAVNESDVLLASASNAIIVGFNVRPERSATQLAEKEKIDIRLHTIIYELTDEIKRAMTGMLEPVFTEEFKGRAEVRDVFRVTKVGTVAGCLVQEGSLSRDSQVRLLRDNIVVHTGKIGSLKRFKDDASEVKTGFECGVGIEGYNDVKPGDVIEAFVIKKVASALPA